MDADTVSNGHEMILNRFEQEHVPILLGTQMVAKGLDFEDVTLVGVLSADISLYMDGPAGAAGPGARLFKPIHRTTK